MKEVVTLAIVGAAVGGGRKQPNREQIGDQEKEEEGNEKVCSSVFGN